MYPPEAVCVTKAEIWPRSAVAVVTNSRISEPVVAFSMNTRPLPSPLVL